MTQNFQDEILFVLSNSKKKQLNTHQEIFWKIIMICVSVCCRDLNCFVGTVRTITVCGFRCCLTLMAPSSSKLVAKRPAARQSSQEPKMKRPAAATVNDAVVSLRQGLKGDDDKDEKQEEEGRDKGKGEKWARMKAAGQIPQHILHLYDETAKTMANTRDFRTQIINSLFEKNDKGLFNMNTNKKMFQEAFKEYQNKYAKDETEAFSKSILCGLYFQNSEQAGVVVSFVESLGLNSKFTVVKWVCGTFCDKTILSMLNQSFGEKPRNQRHPR